MLFFVSSRIASFYFSENERFGAHEAMDVHFEVPVLDHPLHSSHLSRTRRTRFHQPGQEETIQLFRVLGKHNCGKCDNSPHHSLRYLQLLIQRYIPKLFLSPSYHLHRLGTLVCKLELFFSNSAACFINWIWLCLFTQRFFILFYPMKRSSRGFFGFMRSAKKLILATACFALVTQVCFDGLGIGGIESG